MWEGMGDGRAWRTFYMWVREHLKELASFKPLLLNMIFCISADGSYYVV